MSSVPPWPAELDALVAAPEHHRLLLENARVRVLDTQIRPGERTPDHTHQWPAVHHVVSWGDFVRRAADGTVLVDSRTGSPASVIPSVFWGEPLAPHSLENVGAMLTHIVSVELKLPGDRPLGHDACVAVLEAAAGGRVRTPCELTVRHFTRRLGGSREVTVARRMCPRRPHHRRVRPGVANERA